MNIILQLKKLDIPREMEETQLYKGTEPDSPVSQSTV